MWKKAARAAGKTCSDWLRELANKESALVHGAVALARKHRRARK